MYWIIVCLCIYNCILLLQFLYMILILINPAAIKKKI